MKGRTLNGATIYSGQSGNTVIEQSVRSDTAQHTFHPLLCTRCSRRGCDYGSVYYDDENGAE